MIQRSAKLCGIDTEMNTIAIRDVLSGFIYYVKASIWNLYYYFATEVF